MMTEQREKPGITIEQLNVTFGRPADAGGYCSGGQIENFREGWALHIMGPTPATKAHWFTRKDFETASALCGRPDAPVRWLYGRGNFPCCQRCVKKLNRMNSAARVTP